MANTSTTGTVTRGVQQPYEIFLVEISESIAKISVLIFPNPTENGLTLQIVDFNNENLYYKIFDLQGKFIQSKQIVSNQTEIDMSSLPSSSYYVQIILENEEMQLYKIIKN